jgi:hypothetical protein
MTAMMNEEERFEADLRAAMRAEPASARLRHRILARATPRSRNASGALPRWLAAIDPRNWRLPVLVELGALAAAASLAVGVFIGASGDVLGTSTTSASADTTVDLVALAYDDTSGSGDQQ